MFQSLDVFKTSMAMARHAGQMQAVTAQNIANADTPRYKAKDLPSFHGMMGGSSGAMRATRAKHLNGSQALQARAEERSKDMDPNGNTVSLELEMVKAVDAKRQHDRALSIYRSGLSIMRASINTR